MPAIATVPTDARLIKNLTKFDVSLAAINVRALHAALAQFSKNQYSLLANIRQEAISLLDEMKQDVHPLKSKQEEYTAKHKNLLSTMLVVQKNCLEFIEQNHSNGDADQAIVSAKLHNSFAASLFLFVIANDFQSIHGVLRPTCWFPCNNKRTEQHVLVRRVNISIKKIDTALALIEGEQPGNATGSFQLLSYLLLRANLLEVPPLPELIHRSN